MNHTTLATQLADDLRTLATSSSDPRLAALSEKADELKWTLELDHTLSRCGVTSPHFARKYELARASLSYRKPTPR